MMTHDEMIAVIQAHKEGKKIQRRESSRAPWSDFNGTLNWNFAIYDYRVAPQPREVWLVYSGEVRVSCYAYKSQAEAETIWPNKTYVRFIEAPETPSQNAKAQNP